MGTKPAEDRAMRDFDLLGEANRVDDDGNKQGKYRRGRFHEEAPSIWLLGIRLCAATG